MLRIFLAAMAICTLHGQAVAQGASAHAVESYKTVCLNAAPDFSGYRAKVKAAGFHTEGSSWMLSDCSARIDVFETEQGCDGLAILIAPGAQATAKAVFDATTASSATLTSLPSEQIAAVQDWSHVSNTLQLESDARGQVPLVRAYLLSQTNCPVR